MYILYIHDYSEQVLCLHATHDRRPQPPKVFFLPVDHTKLSVFIIVNP